MGDAPPPKKKKKHKSWSHVGNRCFSTFDFYDVVRIDSRRRRRYWSADGNKILGTLYYIMQKKNNNNPSSTSARRRVELSVSDFENWPPESDVYGLVSLSRILIWRADERRRLLIHP